MRPDALYQSPNALAAHYSHFRVADRLLLTGHSHQAWPDVGRAAQLAAWDDAARLGDDKWARAFEQADRVRSGFARLLGDPAATIALGTSTHELLVRWLSALALDRRPRLVTTDGEFHSARRQLDRLAEAGLEIVKVPADPAASLAERLAAAVTDRTAGVVVSAVMYRNAHIVPHLGALLAACRRRGAELLVDVYHALNVVPFDLRVEGLDGAFLVGGGYKYCQLGEGNCFLRVPPDSTLRPVITGWYSEFDALTEAPAGAVAYGPGPWRFAGATYDPTSHYRAAAVFEFFEDHGLTPALLREISQHQVARLARRFDELNADPAVIRRDTTVPLDALGGFLALRAPRAGDIGAQLRRGGVWVDARGDHVRLGPAPYLSDSQLDAAIAALTPLARSARG